MIFNSVRLCVGKTPRRVLSNLLHRSNSRGREWPTVGLKVTNNVFGDVAQVCIDLSRIVPVDTRDEVRALTKIRLILFAPFNPFVILVTGFHLVPRQWLAELGILDIAWRRRRLAH